MTLRARIHTPEVRKKLGSERKALNHLFYTEGISETEPKSDTEERMKTQWVKPHPESPLRP